MIEIQKYARKPFIVDAVQVTEANLAEVAKWCDGEVRTVTKDGVSSVLGAKYIKVKVKRPLTVRQTKAFVGDWVLVAGTSFKVYTPGAFEKSFDPIATSEVLDFIDRPEMDAEVELPAESLALLSEAGVE
jgi:hypothetical protein